MYFDDALLNRILRIRARVDRATADLTAALGLIDTIGQLSPRQPKGKGRGTPAVRPDPAHDPVTSARQADLNSGCLVVESPAPEDCCRCLVVESPVSEDCIRCLVVESPAPEDCCRPGF